MRVARNTATSLILDETPWLVGLGIVFGWLVFFGIGMFVLFAGILAGLIFIAFSFVFGIAFYLFVRRVQIVFQRNENWVEIRRQSLNGYEKIRYDLDEIEKAIVEASTDDQQRVLSRTTLVIPHGQSAGLHPLTDHYSNGSGAEKTANTINHWLGGALVK